MSQRNYQQDGWISNSKKSWDPSTVWWRFPAMWKCKLTARRKKVRNSTIASAAPAGLTLNFSAARMDKNGRLQWMKLTDKFSIKNPKSKRALLKCKSLLKSKSLRTIHILNEEQLALCLWSLLFWRASHCWILQWRWLSWWGNYGVDTKCKWSTQLMSAFEAQASVEHN